jgi:hypothetical protein
MFEEEGVPIVAGIQQVIRFGHLLVAIIMIPMIGDFTLREIAGNL